jgi:hypothetical protein
MQEYLETTSLGDLARKATEIKIEESEPVKVNPFEAALSDLQQTEAVLRPNLGEFN